MIPVLVTAAPREGPNLTDRCLASLVGSRLPGGLVSAEPGTQIAPWAAFHFEIIQHDQRLGEWRNFVTSARLGLARLANHDLLLTVQDDVIFCRRLGQFLPALRWPSGRCGALHVYTSGAYRKQPRGISKLPDDRARDMKANCALLWHRQALHEVVDYAELHGWRGHPRRTIDEPAAKVGTDTFIGETLTALGWEIWICRPSLADHDAEHSAVGHGGSGGVRHGLEFIGIDGDPFQHFPVRDPGA